MEAARWNRQEPRRLAASSSPNAAPDGRGPSRAQVQGGGSDSWPLASAAVDAAFYSVLVILDNEFVQAGKVLHLPRIDGL